ncbi:MAG: hypothetical protein QM811_21870 [Pirellulales bacterium]
MPRVIRAVALGLMVIASTTWRLAAQTPTKPAAETPTPSTSEKSTHDPVTHVGPGVVEGYQANGRWREGTRLSNVPGKFQLVGERAKFVSADGKLQFPVVENLLAERVAKMVVETSEPLTWIVQGTVTEYKNGNFLTLRHAVITSRIPAGAPAPEHGESNGVK